MGGENIFKNLNYFFVVVVGIRRKMYYSLLGCIFCRSFNGGSKFRVCCSGRVFLVGIWGSIKKSFFRERWIKLIIFF